MFGALREFALRGGNTSCPASLGGTTAIIRLETLEDRVVPAYFHPGVGVINKVMPFGVIVRDTDTGANMRLTSYNQPTRLMGAWLINHQSNVLPFRLAPDFVGDVRLVVGVAVNGRGVKVLDRTITIAEPNGGVVNFAFARRGAMDMSIYVTPRHVTNGFIQFGRTRVPYLVDDNPIQMSVSSIFLDANPGTGPEELARLTVGNERSALKKIVVRDNEGGFAGMNASDIVFRYWSETNGAYGPALGIARVIDAFSVEITVNAAITPLDGASQWFNLSTELGSPMQIDAVFAGGVRNRYFN